MRGDQLARDGPGIHAVFAARDAVAQHRNQDRVDVAGAGHDRGPRRRAGRLRGDLAVRQGHDRAVAFRPAGLAGPRPGGAAGPESQDLVGQGSGRSIGCQLHFNRPRDPELEPHPPSGAGLTAQLSDFYVNFPTTAEFRRDASSICLIATFVFMRLQKQINLTCNEVTIK
jgi:hypothetical protein